MSEQTEWERSASGLPSTTAAHSGDLGAESGGQPLHVNDAGGVLSGVKRVYVMTAPPSEGRLPRGLGDRTHPKCPVLGLAPGRTLLLRSLALFAFIHLKIWKPPYF